jgi:arylsulfatase A-like enzyme
VSGFEDWLPTIAELAGIPASQLPAADGISLAPTLRGLPQTPRKSLYREFPGYGGQQSIRVGDWKLIRQQLSKKNLTTTQLFNLHDDPDETNDLAPQHPELVAKLSQQMQAERTPSTLFPLPNP